MPARVVRLPWTKFHCSVIVGRGVSWILDGLEIQIVATDGCQHALNISTTQVGFTGTVNPVGEVVGALQFGRLADKLGRTGLFIPTLAIHLLGGGIAGMAHRILHRLFPLGLIITYLRRQIPESPRWLRTHGTEKEAEDTVDKIEGGIVADGHELSEIDDDLDPEVTPHQEHPVPPGGPHRPPEGSPENIPGVSMMITQLFLYNAIFITYALVLQSSYHISPSGITVPFFPFAPGNLAGPLVLGRLFDSMGRRKMIFASYVLSGIVLAVSAALFEAGAD